MREELPHTWCALFELHLTNCRFRVIYEKAVIKWKDISAEVPQGGVLGPILYLIYTAVISKDDNTTRAIFANNMAIFLTSENQLTSIDNLYKSTDNTFFLEKTLGN